MKFCVSVTDKDWYRQLSELRPDEVNFWKPSARAFRMLAPGEPMLFKLHHPDNKIVGVGYFVSYSVLPVSLAWAAFGVKNGVSDLAAFRSRIRKYKTASDLDRDPNVGCIILTQPLFFMRDNWIDCPESFSKNIVAGKSYDTVDEDGRYLWAQVEDRMGGVGRYGDPAQVRRRLGQGAFRVLVTDAYERRCAITGERTLPVLEAAHIMPFKDGPNATSNGLLLRADVHNLYDRGLITVTPDYRVEVSKRIHEDYGNGRMYYAMHGQPLSVIPRQGSDQPRRDLLEWHNQNVYDA